MRTVAGGTTGYPVIGWLDSALLLERAGGKLFFSGFFFHMKEKGSRTLRCSFLDPELKGVQLAAA